MNASIFSDRAKACRVRGAEGGDGWVFEGPSSFGTCKGVANRAIALALANRTWFAFLFVTSLIVVYAFLA